MIPISELGKRGFFEVLDDSNQIIYANDTNGILLIRNGEGFIPYYGTPLERDLSKCEPLKQIDDLDELDTLIQVCK